MPISVTTIKKKLLDRLKNDLMIGNVPFREDDESTNMWKIFLDSTCKTWLNDFWSPVLQNIEKNACNNTLNCVNFVTSWVLHRLYEKHTTFPIMIKQILTELMKHLDDHYQNDPSKATKIKNLVFVNLIFLRFLASWVFQLISNTNPQFAIIASISKLLIQIVSIALTSQSNSTIDPLLKSCAINQSQPLKVLLKKLSKPSHLSPFDIRRHIDQPVATTTTTTPSSPPPRIVIQKNISPLSPSKKAVFEPRSTFNHFMKNHTVEKIQETLFDHGLYEVMEVFDRFKVDGQMFIQLTDLILKTQLNIQRVSLRKKLLKLILEEQQHSQ